MRLGERKSGAKVIRRNLNGMMGKENNSFSVSVVYLLAVLASLPCLRILLCVVFIDFLPFLFLRLFDVDRFLFFFRLMGIRYY